MSNYKKIIIIIVVGAVIALATILYFFVNPEYSVLMPKCPMKMLTGYDCPSCGVQRAIHAVLHGDFAKAISYNPFFVISVPYFLLVLYSTVFKNSFAVKLRSIVCHRYALYTYIVLFFLWWILRNVLF